MEKTSPKLYSIWECIDHIEYPYNDKAYALLMKIIEQSSYDKNNRYLYTKPMVDAQSSTPNLFINRYREVTEKMHLIDIDSITTRYNDIVGVKDYFKTGGYDKRNPIVIGRKYDKTLKTYPIILSQSRKYVDPSYVEENLISKVLNYDQNSYEFFNALANCETFYKDPAISLILDRIMCESSNAYYNSDIIELHDLVACFFNVWSYKEKNQLNYNNLRKLGLFIKEQDEAMELKNPKVKQLSFFN